MAGRGWNQLASKIVCSLGQLLQTTIKKGATFESKSANALALQYAGLSFRVEMLDMLFFNHKNLSRDELAAINAAVLRARSMGVNFIVTPVPLSLTA